MEFPVILIAVICYILSLPDICALVSIYGFQDDIRKYGPADFAHICRRFGGAGLCYALLVDIIRALISVLLGGILLKSAGHPEIGKLLALFFTAFFMLSGQAFPILRHLRPRRDLVYPALLLIFVDWRLFLISGALCGIVYVLTGLRGLTALLAAVILPVFSLIFHNWWLFTFLILLSGLSLAFAYLDDIRKSFALLPQRIDDIPLRLRAITGKIRQKLDEDDESSEGDDTDNP